MTITYATEPRLAPDEFIDLMVRSGLDGRRPVRQAQKVRRMLKYANLIVTARDGSPQGPLLGVARSMTDFAFFCYCSDLAVDRDHQGRGIGRELMRRSWREAGHDCSFFLLSAPAARGFYERVKMPRLDNAYGFIQPSAESGKAPPGWR